MLLQLLVISLLQGLTEWLPISSSGHVLLASSWFGFETRDELMINAMAHVGTLFAVLLYFWRDVSRATLGGFELVGSIGRSKSLSENGRLAALILASMPIALFGTLAYELLAPDTLKDGLRSVYTVAATTIIFGLLLWWADQRPTTRQIEAMGFGQAFWIGASQMVAALLPGTSRSGITMTVARGFGIDRQGAARFSMLIGAPILAAGGLYAFLKLMQADEAAGAVGLTEGLIVAGLSFLSGYASIFVLMALLKRMSFLPFVIYRLILGAVLLLASPLGFHFISA